jgi:anti-sigma factor RsiW
MYTEQDIQDYLDGNFAGDTAGMEEYLAHHAGAQKQVQMYNLLYAGLKEQAPVALSVNLADAVMHRLQRRAAAKELWWTRAWFITMWLWLCWQGW